MGDCKNREERVDFDRTLKLIFLGSNVTTTDAGLAYQELDEALSLTEMGTDAVDDSRLAAIKQHGLLPLLPQSIYSRLAGYEDVSDAERLCVDPTMRHVVGSKASQPSRQAASTSEVGRFETEMLATKNNLTALGNKWPSGGKQRRKRLRGGRRASGRPVKPTSGWKIGRPNGIPYNVWLRWRSCRSERIQAEPIWEITGYDAP